MVGIFNRITFVSEIHISSEDWHKAGLLCEEKDPKDIPHVALSLFLNCQLWSGDEKLKKHLINKGYDSIFEF
jgi:predicted nucleic acid-binding protein